MLHVLALLRRGGVSWFDCQESEGLMDEQERWCGGVGTGQLSVSDTQSASHALALAIVVWNLRNPFDRLAVSVWVLFWTSPGDSGSRERQERRKKSWRAGVTCRIHVVPSHIQ